MDFSPACGLRNNVYTGNMTTNDNTVNIKSGSSSYHHGDLRAALIEEGLSQIGERPAEKVSLREIARKVGVSATAVYRHFPNKAALLGALCEVGSRKLTRSFDEVIEATPGGIATFEAMGRAYVRFALANPSLFRLMMTKAPPANLMNPDEKGDPGAFEMLSSTLQSVLPQDAPADVRRIKRLQAWSIVHGLAMLMLDGQVPPDETLIDSVVSRSFL